MMKKSIMMTSLTKMCVLVAVLFAFTSNGMYAQTTTGKDFWVAFGQFKGLDGTKNGSMIYDSRHLDIQIKIVATAETYVDFYFSANSQLNQTDVHVSANTVYTRILKDNEKAAVYSYSDNVLGTTTSNSLHITSDQPVSVYALIRYNGMGDATNVLPINALGKEYYHISYTGSSAYLKDAMTLVATEDDTDITIYNNNNTQIVNHTNLSKGKVVYYALDGEMSGYRVVSDKPIAHFDTHRSAVIPNVATNWENLYQQMAPVNSWGKTFFVPSLKNVANQERLRIRVVASQDGTEIEYKGANIIGARKTLGKGQFAELEIDNTNNGCIITSNKPVGVCSFLLSHSPGNTSTYGGPANVWIPPVEQSVPVTTISSFIPNNSPNTFSTIDANYAIIVTPTATKNETKINGLTPTAALSWTDREGYSFAQYALTDDSPHTFSNQAGLTVLVAGLGDHESYYYLAGASMYNLNMAFTVNGVNHQQAMGTTLCENNVEFKAKVEYAKNPLTLKWFIDGVEQYAYRDKLSCYATLAQGNHTVRMDVVDLYEVEQSISTNFTVETPVLTVPSEMRVNENVTLLSSANGTWKSSDNNVATVTPAGVATGVAEGTVRFTFTSAAGCTSVSDFVTVKPDRKTANDTIALLYNTSVSFNAVVDGMLNCNTNDITLNIMDGVKHGALTENNKIYTYTPTRNWYGIDSVKYSVTCNPQSVGSYDATVYFIVSKPKSMYNVACPDATIVIGMNKIQDVQYYWYNAPTGGNPSPPTAIDSLILTKNSSDIETRYVEARYKGFKSSRYEISVHKSENCGDINPTGCIVDGQVLFSEDFGGNNENDPRISLTKLPENATKYTFLSGDDKIKADQYALVKYVDNGYTPWHQKFSDHTHFNDMTKGYMFLVDASDNAGKFYETTITGLCGNINKMYFSAWVANEIKKDWNSSIIPDDPVLKFELSDNDGNIIGTYVTSKVPRDNTDAIKWRNYGFTFDPKGQSSLTLRIYNNTGGWNGNDFALDDIEIRVCFPPITVENKLFDTTFVGKSYDFKAAYIDDGTFTTLDNQLAAQWEYSANNIDWNLVAGTTKIESATAIGSTYTINSAALSDKGYYRFVVSNPSTINNKNCRVVSKSIALAVEDSNIVADTIALLYNTEVTFDALANDVYPCSSNVVVNIVPNSGLTMGSMTKNSDNTFTYTPHTNQYGIDNVEYSIQCPSGNIKTAKIYFIISKPLSLYNAACPGASIKIGMNSIAGVEYYWYSASTGGSLLSLTPKDELTVTKDDSDIQSWYVEARYNGIKSPRYEISVLLSDNCATTIPEGCAVEGQLVFREDFGGNNKNDTRISTAGLPSGVTGYTFDASKGDKITSDKYALVKYVDNGYAPWHQKFSDHTNPDDMTRGYMFLVDASNNHGMFYKKEITGLCGNINKMYFSAWVANEIMEGAKDWENKPIPHDPVLKFELSDNDGNIIGMYVTSKVPRDSVNNIKWRNYGFSFDPKGHSSLTLRIYNNTDGSNGNDFALDDIEIRICVPPISLENKLFDTIYVGDQYEFKASYNDVAGTFSASGNKLAAQWEYSADAENWTKISGSEKTVETQSISSTYTLDNAALTNKGYYRFVVSNHSDINSPNCRVVSKNIALYVENSNAVADTVALLYNSKVTFDALANDVFTCNSSDITVDTVSNSGLIMGSMTKNSDNTFTYTPKPNQYGIDNVEYSIKCPSGNVRTAKIYFIISKPLSLYNIACPDTDIEIGMHSIPGVDYYWYNALTGGNLLWTDPSDKRTVTKYDSDKQSWYLEARYNGITSPRYEISVLKSDDCGQTNPTGCIADGQLVFREDFGGNNTTDPRISLDSITTTDYKFETTDELHQNEYALVKYIKNSYAKDYGWQQEFSDHTNPGDTTRGYMFLVDASENININKGKFYETTITGLCDKMNEMYFSAWVANVIPTENANNNDNPILKFELSNNGNIVGTYITSEIPKDAFGNVQWRNYGFFFDSKGYSELTLKIYNNRVGSDGNDFALDDIEIRFCVPPITVNKLTEKICAGSSHTFQASYTDDGTFTDSGNQLAYRWEYSYNGKNNWYIIGIDTVVSTTSVTSTYTIDDLTDNNKGYYRFIVSNPTTINDTACRVVSEIMSVDIFKPLIVSDLRIMVAPSTNSHKVYLTSFIDTTNVVSVKWDNLGAIPKILDETTGEFDAEQLTGRRVYTYKYTVTSKCDTSTAKVYVFTSTDKLPIRNNREVFVCKDLELSKYVQLNQILGLEGNGTWSYPGDVNGSTVTADNVVTSSAKFGSSKIFNAQQAYADAGTLYDVAGKPDTKAFKFRYTPVSGDPVDFTIIVGE